MKFLISIIFTLSAFVGFSEGSFKPSLVDLKELNDVILDSDQIIVYSSSLDDAPKLYESREKKDIIEFSQALDLLEPYKWFHCLCLGTQTIVLLKEDIVLIRITNHHSESIRTNLSGCNITIRDKTKFFEWFDERNIEEPRIEFERDEKRRIERENNTR